MFTMEDSYVWFRRHLWSGPRFVLLPVRCMHRPSDPGPAFFGLCFLLTQTGHTAHCIDHEPSSMICLRSPCHTYPSSLRLMTFASGYIVSGASYPRITSNACPDRVRGANALTTRFFLPFIILHDASCRTVHIGSDCPHFSLLAVSAGGRGGAMG